MMHCQVRHCHLCVSLQRRSETPCIAVPNNPADGLLYCAGSASAVHVQAVLRAGLVLWHCGPGGHVDHQGVQP